MYARIPPFDQVYPSSAKRCNLFPKTNVDKRAGRGIFLCWSDVLPFVKNISRDYSPIMKTFFQVILIGIIAWSTTACLNEDITGAMKADTSTGSFNSLISSGLLTKFNSAQTKNLVLTGTNGTKVLTLTISEIGGDTTINCISEGVYQLSNTTQTAQLVYSSGTNAFANIIDCTVEVTKCDEAEKAVSGTFKGTVASVTGDTITFTNGTFEDVVFQQ